MGIGTKLSELIEANGTNPNELAKKSRCRTNNHIFNY